MLAPARVVEYVNDRINELILRDGEATQFELMRIEREIQNMEGGRRQSLAYAVLYAIWGKRGLAVSWLESANGYDRNTFLEFAGSAQAAFEYHTAADALRDGLSRGWIDSRVDAMVVFSGAIGVGAFSLAEELKTMLGQQVIEDSGYSGTLEVMDRAKAFGLEDRDIQEYLRRSLLAIEGRFKDCRRPTSFRHVAHDEMPDSIIIEVEVPADPDDFGDIMWDMCNIDRTGIPEAVTRHVILDPIPAE